MAAIGKMAAVLKRIPSRLAFADGILCIPLAVLIGSLPRIVRGVSCGHDFDFHFVSWLEVQRAWSQGVPYPHWAQTPNWGAGEARFIFYPPLTWILGAALAYLFHSDYIHWEYVPEALTALFLLGSGLSVRALARQFLPARNATLAGAIAAATPYGLFTAYERTAFSELAATAWLPLLLLYALRPPPKQTASSPYSLVPSPHSQVPSPESRVPSPYSLVPSPYSAPLALIVALTWLTNAPAGVMASYLLAYAALSAAILYRAWWPILRASVGAVLGLGIAAFFLIPAAYEQRWIAIRQALDIGMRVTDSWLFARHAAPDLELHDQVLRMASSLFVLTAAVGLAALAIALLRRKLPASARPWWLTLALLFPLLFLLQLPISAPIWAALPKLEFLQFPWRWLAVLGIPFSIFLAAAAPLSTRLGRRWAAVGWTALMLALAAGATLFFFQFCDSEDETGSQAQVFEVGTGVEGTDEYAALGSDNSLVASGLPNACLVSDPNQALGESDSGSEPVWYDEQGSCDDIFSARLWQNEHKIIDIEADQAGFAILRLRRYPAWRITVNGNRIDALSPALAAREDGLIVLPVPAGDSTIDIRWSDTPDQILGRWVSGVSLLLVAGLWLWRRRQTRPHLSSS